MLNALARRLRSALLKRVAVAAEANNAAALIGDSASRTVPHQVGTFELEIGPLRQVAKYDQSGRMGVAVVEPLTGVHEGGFGVVLNAGESIRTPPITVGPAQRLVIGFEIDSGVSTDTSLAVDYSLPPAARDAPLDLWVRLLDIRLPTDTPAGHRSTEISLETFGGRVVIFRLQLLAPSAAGRCLVYRVRVCAAHQDGRVNALANYALRMRNEMQHFSGAAYTHPMYGPPVQGTEMQAVLPATPSKEVTLAVDDLQMQRAREVLAAVAPGAGETAYDFAMRSLGAILPMDPPNFFARVALLSATKPLYILSICAGAARIEEQILAHCRGQVALALVDSSLALIQRAAARLMSSAANCKIECMTGDINEGLPGKGQFDIIICVSALHHVANLELVLAQINQRLSDDGEFWSIGEQVGRNGNRLWPDAAAIANALFAELPERLRRNSRTGKIDPVISDRDFSAGCFEGIRSEELESLLDSYLLPEQIYKRNAFLWRLVDTTYSDNFALHDSEDVEHLRRLVLAEAMHWADGGRSTELHGIYKKRRLRT